MQQEELEFVSRRTRGQSVGTALAYVIYACMRPQTWVKARNPPLHPAPLKQGAVLGASQPTA